MCIFGCYICIHDGIVLSMGRLIWVPTLNNVWYLVGACIEEVQCLGGCGAQHIILSPFRCCCYILVGDVAMYFSLSQLLHTVGS